MAENLKMGFDNIHNVLSNLSMMMCHNVGIKTFLTLHNLHLPGLGGDVKNQGSSPSSVHDL